jgi:hypothetical protein
MSKGSRPRPCSVSQNQYSNNYDAIFRKPSPRVLEEAKLEDEEFERLDNQIRDLYNKHTEETK